MPDPDLDLERLATALQELSRFANEHAPPRPPPTREFIVDHLQADPTLLPIVSDEHPMVDRPNLQLALDAWAHADGRTLQMVGLASPHRGPMELGVAELIVATAWGPPIVVGPVAFSEVPVGVGATLTCVSQALLLLTDGDVRLACLVGQTPDYGMRPPALRLELIAADRDHSVAFLAELRQLMRRHSVYRGQVVSLSTTPDNGPYGGEVGVTFHERDTLDRDGIVLPEGVLERIERHTIDFSEHADDLRRAGRELKRGLLLFGPPGTGKTLTVRYLVGRSPERTVVLIPGASVTVLAAGCSVARQLAPSTVVLEDVDLVAEERTLFGHGQNPMLAALLNEMDEASADDDVLFVLTTNRADLLEPALAARPGRIDQAVEIGLPDAACRRRLLALYGSGVDMTEDDVVELVERLDGVAAAFVKELLRRATLLGAIEGLPTTVQHIRAALDELYADTGALTRSVLGATPPPTDDADAAFPMPPGLVVPAEIRRALGVGGPGPHPFA